MNTIKQHRKGILLFVAFVLVIKVGIAIGLIVNLDAVTATPLSPVEVKVVTATPVEVVRVVTNNLPLNNYCDSRAGIGLRCNEYDANDNGHQDEIDLEITWNCGYYIWAYDHDPNADNPEGNCSGLIDAAWNEFGHRIGGGYGNS